MRKLVDATVNQLRLRQVECADLDADARRRRMDAVIGDALGTLVPSERRAFLNAMLERFPTGETVVDPEPAVRAAFDENLLANADFLTARLAAVVSTLCSDRRRAIALELARSGLPQVGDPPWPQRAADDVQKALDAPLADIDAGRALELLALLAKFAIDLDHVARMTWCDLAGSVAPTEPQRSPNDLRLTIACCLSGDPDAPSAVVAPAVSAIGRLLAHLIGSLPLVGRFAAEHVRKLAPAAIRAAAAQEAGRLFESYEKRCWRAYERLARAFDEGPFSDAVRTSVARQVDDWLAHRSEEPR